MASIQESLYAALAADPALADLVGDRIYPGQVPDDETPPPWLYYAVPESLPFDELDDDVDYHADVEFHALGETYAQAKAILDTVFLVLDTYVGGQIRRALWQGTSEETTEDGYHHSARFRMWSKRASVVVTPGATARIITGIGYVTLQASSHTLTLGPDGLTLDGVPLDGVDLSVLTPGQVVYYDGTGLASATGVIYSATGSRLTVTGGPISCPGAGANSERFGAGSSAAGDNSVAFGFLASTAPGASGAAVGPFCSVAGNGGTAIGVTSTADGQAVAIGNAVSSPTGSIGVGVSLSGTGTQNIKVGIDLDSAAHGLTIMVGSGVAATGGSEVVLGYCQNPSDDQTVRWVGRSSLQGRDLHRVHHTKLVQTDAIFTTRAVMSVYSFGSLVEYMRAEGGTGAVAAKWGVLGADAIPRQTLPAAATDAATTQALANALRSVLIAFGFCN
jgi:hypothetical protein